MKPRRVWLPAIRAGSGSDVFVERLAAGLAARGIDAKVTWFPHRCEIFPGLLRSVAPPPGTDIIHANAAQAFAFQRSGIPLVATELHYVLDPAYRPHKSWVQHLYHRALIGRWLSRSFAKATAVTAISEFTAQVLRETAQVNVTRTIPLWVDTELFTPASGVTRTPGSPFRLLFVGNDSHRKGADVVPLLAARLGEGFEIYCTAGLRQRTYRAMPGNVRVLSRLSIHDLVRAYQTCDAVLVPSRYEGFGYAALEGMACGKPVVGFACGAVAEVVGAIGRPWLAVIDDLETLKSYCHRLAADHDLARELGQMGRKRAALFYTEESAVSEYIELYSALLGPSKRASMKRKNSRISR